MTDWKPDERHERQIGVFMMVPERRGGETAHRVYTPHDGRGIRVLPVDHASGQKRSRIIVGALAALEDIAQLECDHDDLEHPEFDPYLYLVGVLESAGIPWESVGDVREVTVEEWLSSWFEDRGRFAGPGYLLADLEAAGWKIERAG